MTDDDDIKYPTRVLRLRILWKNGEFNVVKEVGIPQKTLPKSANLPAAAERGAVTGFWVEGTDAKGRALYRRILEDPLQNTVEIFERNGSIRRVAANRTEFYFDVLLPDIPQIVELRIFSTELAGKGARGATIRPVAILKIRERQATRRT
jgi:hypothetical protein